MKKTTKDYIVVLIPTLEQWRSFNEVLKKFDRPSLQDRCWDFYKYDTAIKISKSGIGYSSIDHYSQQHEYPILDITVDFIEICDFLGLVSKPLKEITEQDLAKEVCVENFWIQLEKSLTEAGGSIPRKNLEKMTLKEFSMIVAPNGIRPLFLQKWSISAVSTREILDAALRNLKNECNN